MVKNKPNPHIMDKESLAFYMTKGYPVITIAFTNSGTHYSIHYL